MVLIKTRLYLRGMAGLGAATSSTDNHVNRELQVVGPLPAGGDSVFFPVPYARRPRWLFRSEEKKGTKTNNDETLMSMTCSCLVGLFSVKSSVLPDGGGMCFCYRSTSFASRSVATPSGLLLPRPVELEAFRCFPCRSCSLSETPPCLRGSTWFCCVPGVQVLSSQPQPEPRVLASCECLGASSVRRTFLQTARC